MGQSATGVRRARISLAEFIGSVTAGRCPQCTGDGLREAELALDRGNQERGYPLGDPSVDWKSE